MGVSNVDIAEVRAWAHEGGEMAKRYFNNVGRELKADQSWVTQADVEVEHMLREHIARRYPDHGVMGEEHGVGEIDREFVWSIDPIDGTGAFVSGLPLWCVSIGLMRRGVPYLGVVYLPILNDYYWTDGEGGAFWNEKPIRVITTDTIQDNDWLAVSSYAHRTFEISFPGKTRSLSSIATDICYVARGSALGAVIAKAKLWDVAAAMAILQAAGGVVHLLSGPRVETTSLLDGRSTGEPFIAAAPEMIERLRSYVAVR
ncbi:inositol-phosphate phosphatase [Oscillochloris trichoides DG-6]|uniref:inositol-phosphate phosphatase n=1 Tax=Oscillochloris trichoides DG-6 TaxID=765420 RepID=E1IDX7_9CHLR|nr:inositol-phosphate phosphatase [Oscillochloris trichoides DG-6]